MSKLRVEPNRISSALTEQLHSRIRQPAAPSSVASSLPILFFGDALSARLLTVGLNPSDQEYVDAQGDELQGAMRRFETLKSLGSSSRAELSDQQCEQAIKTMRRYFEEGKPIYRWFRPLARVTDAMGVSFVNRTAAHLDLVQESTQLVWSGLPDLDRDALLVRDLPFLSWQLGNFPARAVACNGATVLRKVVELAGAEIVESGAMQRIRWTVARATAANGAVVGIVGWNYPLTRPTGLGISGECELGVLLGTALDTMLGHDWRL